MNNNKKIKLIGTVLGIILFCLLIARFTYAWLTWESEKINVSGNTACFDIDYTKGNVVTEDLTLVDANYLITDNKIIIKKGMAVTNINAGKSSKCSKVNARLILNFIPNTIPTPYQTGGSNEGALNYVITSYDPKEYNTISSTSLNGKIFNIIKKGTITSTNKINSILEEPFANDGTIQNYLIIFYIDGNKVNNEVQDTNVKISIEVIANQYTS